MMDDDLVQELLDAALAWYDEGMWGDVRLARAVEAYRSAQASDIEKTNHE